MTTTTIDTGTSVHSVPDATESAEQARICRDFAEVPPELEWLANITNPKTRRFYKNDVAEFVAFAGLKDSAALRTVARAHVIAWREDMETQSLGPATIRRKLSALSSLFDYLCERNAVLGNPVDGVERSATNGNDGTLLYHGISGAKNCACCACATHRAARGSCISASRASGTRFASFPFTRWCCA